MQRCFKISGTKNYIFLLKCQLVDSGRSSSQRLFLRNHSVCSIFFCNWVVSKTTSVASSGITSRRYLWVIWLRISRIFYNSWVVRILFENRCLRYDGTSKSGSRLTLVPQSWSHFFLTNQRSLLEIEAGLGFWGWHDQNFLSGFEAQFGGAYFPQNKPTSVCVSKWSKHSS